MRSDRKVFWRLLLSLLPMAALLPSCVRMTHQLEQREPLEINVNVRLQIDRELDEFFEFQERDRPTVATDGTGAPATAPATLPPQGSSQ